MAITPAVYLTGKIYWAKILSDPVFNEYKNQKEWSFEFEPDAEGVELLKQHKVSDRLKKKYDDRGAYLTLRKPELQNDGTPNQPLRVYDADNQEWDREKLIGNGSTGNVKINIKDYGVGKFKGVYPVAVRILDHIPYVSSEFGALDAVAGKPAQAKKLPGKTFMEELNDDVPV